MQRLVFGMSMVVLASFLPMGCNCGGDPTETDGDNGDTHTGRDAGTLRIDGGSSGSLMDASTAMDAAMMPADAAMMVPDAAMAMPDAAMATPDAAMMVPDAAMAMPDAAMAVADAAMMVPDAAMAMPDAAMAMPDAAMPPDAGVCTDCNTWVATTSLPGARSRHTASLLKDGRVLVAGGDDSLGPSNTAFLYSPTDETWVPTGTMHRARYNHTATTLGDGRVLVVGGFGGFDSGGAIYLAHAELYNPNTGMWTEVTPPVQGFVRRGGHTATRLSDGRVLIAGGLDTMEYPSIVEVFDPVSNSVTRPDTLNQVRHVHAAAALDNGRAILLGGQGLVAMGTQATLQTLNDVDVFTGSSVNDASNIPGARWGHAATVLQDGSVLLSGGTNAGALATAATLMVSNLTWSGTGPMAQARWAHEAVLLANGKVLIIGGTNTQTLASCELYDPQLRAFLPAAPMAQERIEHTATRLPDGRVLVVGGSVEAVPMADAELYKPEP